MLTNANGLDGTPQWISLSYSGGPPSKRIQSIPTYDAANNRMMIFGGCKNPSVPCFMLNDVWVLRNANGVGGTPQFTQLSPAGGSPAPRGAYGIGYDGVSNRLMVFGGGGNYPVNHLNDTWVLTNANGLGGAPSWIQLSTATIPPGPYGMSSAYDSTTNELFVVGGVTAAGGATNDVWRLDNANGLGTPEWVQLFPNGGPPPEWDGLSWVSAYDPDNKRMMIFGGTISSAISSTTSGSWSSARRLTPRLLSSRRMSLPLRMPPAGTTRL